jgi:hypothetical protein
MILSTIEVLKKAGDLGLKLSQAPPDRLTYQPLEKCPPGFAEILRAHKPALLSLLEFPFVMMRSQALDGEILFFCEDEQTRAALVEAGAAEWSIYTKEELRILCEQNRIKPFTEVELRKVHEIKRCFGAGITSEDFK